MLRMVPLPISRWGGKLCRGFPYRAFEHRLVFDRGEHRQASYFVAAGDEEDEFGLAGKVDMAERARGAQGLAGGVAGVGPGFGAAGAAFGLDEGLEALALQPL